jgi:hypothetical protein
MEFRPVDVKDLIGISVGMLVVLIPVIGLTIRFAAKPLVDSLISAGVLGTPQARAALEGPTRRELELMARRMLELEQEVARLKGGDGLQPVASFDEGALAGRPVELQRAR